MTVSVTISVNGNYKLPVKYTQGTRQVEQVISGRGYVGPHVEHIPFYHGPDIMTLELGPEEQDHGEPETEIKTDSE